MGLPARITLIRHGQSEANVLNRMLDNGELSEAPGFVLAIPDREVKLTEEGVKQAIKTGIELRNEALDGGCPLKFDYIACSDHTRAKETMGHILLNSDLSHEEVFVDPLIGERNWGDILSLPAEERMRVKEMRKVDPFNSCMPNGEHILMTKVRARILIERLVRGSYQEVLIVSHGEFIESFLSEISKMRTEKFKEFFHESKVGDIRNCQVVTVQSEGGKARSIHSRNFWFDVDHGEIEVPKEKMNAKDLLEETAKVKGFLEDVMNAKNKRGA